VKVAVCSLAVRKNLCPPNGHVKEPKILRLETSFSLMKPSKYFNGKIDDMTH